MARGQIVVEDQHAAAGRTMPTGTVCNVQAWTRAQERAGRAGRL